MQSLEEEIEGAWWRPGASAGASIASPRATTILRTYEWRVRTDPRASRARAPAGAGTHEASIDTPPGSRIRPHSTSVIRPPSLSLTRLRKSLERASHPRGAVAIEWWLGPLASCFWWQLCRYHPPPPCEEDATNRLFHIR
jgi:hypothetical protein